MTKSLSDTRFVDLRTKITILKKPYGCTETIDFSVCTLSVSSAQCKEFFYTLSLSLIEFYMC